MRKAKFQLILPQKVYKQSKLLCVVDKMPSSLVEISKVVSNSVEPYSRSLLKRKKNVRPKYQKLLFLIPDRMKW